jgi:hypothetical protein
VSEKYFVLEMRTTGRLHTVKKRMELVGRRKGYAIMAGKKAQTMAHIVPILTQRFA